MKNCGLKYILIVIFQILIPLLLGTYIYVLFRKTDINVFYWIWNINQDMYRYIIEKRIEIYSIKLPKMVLYNLPDFLWVFAGTSSICMIWRNFDKVAYFWFLLIPFLAIAGELGQLAGFVRGSFDFLDIIFELMGFLLSILTFKIYNYYGLWNTSTNTF